MVLNFQDILLENKEKSAIALGNFVKDCEKTFQFPDLDANNNRNKLWTSIFNLASSNPSPETLANCFSSIRILSREKKNLNELINEEWLTLAQQHAGLLQETFNFTPNNTRIAIEAQKCLSNVIFNSSVAAALCSKNGIVHNINRRTKNYSDKDFPEEVMYFDMKLLFLITALCSEVRTDLRENCHGVENLINVLETQLIKGQQENQIILPDKQVDTICETLKVLFNITVKMDHEDNEEFKTITKVVKQFISCETITPQKKNVLICNLVNLMTNVPGECYGLLLDKINKNEKVAHAFNGYNIETIFYILKFLESRFTEEKSGNSQTELLSPAVTVLLRAAQFDRITRKYLKSEILSPNCNFYLRPEEGTTIRNHLCKILTSPLTHLRDLVAEFLYILCKNNVKRMIKYTGYGNAAGLFAQKGLLGSKGDPREADFSSDSESDTEEYSKMKNDINPVLGCYDPPHPDPMEGMTEEQKEYEALKLVELVDKLTRSGAIKPCTVGENGKPEPIEHVLQLQESLQKQQIRQDSDSD